jgi:hypothetical protein
MPFGVKIKSFKTNNAYMIEELYEAIKDKEFTAGPPSLTKHGLAYITPFPPLDDNNQVWVMPGQMKKGPFTKWSVQKQRIAGVSNMVANMIVDDLTGGANNASSFIGKKAKDTEKLVDITTEELEALGL